MGVSTIIVFDTIIIDTIIKRNRGVGPSEVS